MKKSETSFIAEKNVALFGFDSAWANKVPGAICAITFDGEGKICWYEPKSVLFDEAENFIKSISKNFQYSLIAIDQPTIVKNDEGMRVVEKCAASLVSFIGGGVQPANRKKESFFGEGAPIWTFLSNMNLTEDPLTARDAEEGCFIIEVFPALALPSLNDSFSKRKASPKYNPAKKGKFKQADWVAVAKTLSESASLLGIDALAGWASAFAKKETHKKACQDKLDAAICLLIGLIWRSRRYKASAMLGDTGDGYMITPISSATQERLQKACSQKGVPMIMSERSPQ